MKVNLTSETYILEGQDEEGLIPEGTTSILVDYNCGKIDFIYFAGDLETNERESIPDYVIRKQEFQNHLNSRKLTQKEKEKIAGFLKKLIAQ